MESTLRTAAGAPDLRLPELRLPDLKLIETLGWDGVAFARLDLHLARLERSAERLGWRCGDAQAALWAAAPAAAARLRLTLDSRGNFDVTVAALPVAIPVWRLALAAHHLQSDDPWLTIKSTNRAAYDTARAALPAGLDEVIFQNERGEMCDGTITTLFFDRGEGLCTPPQRCGLLPGVLRAQMLANGTVREAVLQAADIGRVQLWLGNSLRGLIPALFIPPTHIAP